MAAIRSHTFNAAERTFSITKHAPVPFRPRRLSVNDRDTQSGYTLLQCEVHGAGKNNGMTVLVTPGPAILQPALRSSWSRKKRYEDNACDAWPRNAAPCAATKLPEQEKAMGG